MELTRAADYALRGVLYLSMQPKDSLCIISEIAEQMSIPEGFLARIFQTLAKTGIIRSHRGKKGGFTLAKPPSEIFMKDVIEAMEGPIHINRCLNGFDECVREDLCAMHNVWADIQKEIVGRLSRINFEELAEKSRIKPFGKA